MILMLTKYQFQKKDDMVQVSQLNIGYNGDDVLDHYL